MTLRTRSMGDVFVPYGPTDEQLGVSPEQQTTMADTATLAQQLDQVQSQMASQSQWMMPIMIGLGALLLMGVLKR